MHITIGTPHVRDFTPEYVVSLIRTLMDGRYEYSYMFRGGSVINYNRNDIAQHFKGDYLLFIDTDMAWVPADIQKLVEADKDIAVGLYYNRTAPPLPVIVVPPESEANTHLWSLPSFNEDMPLKEPFEITSSGGGFMLIKRKVIDAFFSQEIWPFDPIPHSIIDDSVRCKCGPVGQFPSGLYWEDHSFCWKARQLGFEVWCVPGASIGHVGAAYYMEKSALEQWNLETGPLWAAPQ